MSILGGIPGIGGLIGGVGGSLLGGLLSGGDPFDPLDFMQGILYGQNWQGSKYNPQGGQGIIPSMYKDIAKTQGMYKSLIKQSKGFGKSARQGIKDWEANTNAAGDQSLAGRGLYNTTITDSMHQDTGAQGQRMRTNLNEDLLKMRMGYKIASNQATNQMKQGLYSTMLGPAYQMFPKAAGEANAQGQAAAGWGGIFGDFLSQQNW